MCKVCSCRVCQRMTDGLKRQNATVKVVGFFPNLIKTKEYFVIFKLLSFSQILRVNTSYFSSKRGE